MKPKEFPIVTTIEPPHLDASSEAIPKPPALLVRSGWRQNISRTAAILRYHRLNQLSRRLVSRMQRLLLTLTRGGRWAALPATVPPLRENAGYRKIGLRKLAEYSTVEAAQQAGGIFEGRFRFLNQEANLSFPPDWRLTDHPELPHLWRFHLHYHEYLFGAIGDPSENRSNDKVWELIAHWIQNNSLCDSRTLLDAWHPFCISRRLPVWLVLWDLSPPPENLQPLILRSIIQQARFLASHLERDLGGNHLLENAKALALAGCFFEEAEAERWRRKAWRILEREIPQQILPHGEHFERSPMYHVQMLEALLDVRDASFDVEPELAWLCDKTVRPMAMFLVKTLHPDQEIGLLGDSTFAEAPSAQNLLRHLEIAAPDAQAKQSAQVIGDYWMWRDGEDFLLFDAGPVGADHLPAHAHADLLTFEASLGGERLIVDAGVFNYEDDPMRQYCRSTAAHNVLQIDGVDQCDLWSKFRMGERGWPSALKTGRSGEFDWAQCAHNAYRRLKVPEVGRWMAARPGGPWIIVDWARGRGVHRLTNRLHFHPDVSLEQTDPDRLHLSHKGSVFVLSCLGQGHLGIESGWYCPRFGVRIPNPVARWEADCALPAVCGWFLSPDPDHPQPTLSHTPDGLVLSWNGGDSAQALEVCLWPRAVL